MVQNRKVLNLVGTNLGTVGPFCSAHAAWIAAKQRELKLGMSLRELERFMTRMRKDRKTEVQIVPRTGGRARPKDAHQGRLTSAAGPTDVRGGADGRGRRTDAGPTDARGRADGRGAHRDTNRIRDRDKVKDNFKDRDRDRQRHRHTQRQTLNKDKAVTNSEAETETA